MEWNEREQQIRERLEGSLSPAADFGWAVESLRAAMDELKRLRAADVAPKRRERKT